MARVVTSPSILASGSVCRPLARISSSTLCRETGSPSPSGISSPRIPSSLPHHTSSFPPPTVVSIRCALVCCLPGLAIAAVYASSTGLRVLRLVYRPDGRALLLMRIWQSRSSLKQTLPLACGGSCSLRAMTRLSSCVRKRVVLQAHERVLLSPIFISRPWLNSTRRADKPEIMGSRHRRPRSL